MVRVPVPAEVVVGRDDVRLEGADEEHEPADGLVKVRLPEAPRVAVPGAAHHVRVAVAEVLPLGHAEGVHRALELAHPDLAEPAVVVRRVHVGDDDLAHLATGARDEDHAMAGPHRLRHRPPGADRLVVRVGVHGHEGGAMGCGGRLTHAWIVVHPPGIVVSLAAPPAGRAVGQLGALDCPLGE